MTKSPNLKTSPSAPGAIPKPVEKCRVLRPRGTCRNIITVIGRGHSGTRAMSATLKASGVYTGEPLNESSDLIPADDFYEACRVISRHVKHLGGLKWDFSHLHTMPIDPGVHPAGRVLPHDRFCSTPRPSSRGMEAAGDDADFPVDRPALPQHPVHLLDPRPARLHLGRAPHRRPGRLRRALR